jgi:hypothetical protein
VACTADATLAALRAKPRARPPRTTIMMLVNHHGGGGEPPPAPVFDALIIALEVRDYAVAQARRSTVQRARETGRSMTETAAELGVDARTTRARKPRTVQSKRPKNADLYDAILLHIERGQALPADIRAAIAEALGLLGDDGQWRHRVLSEARRVVRESELFQRAAEVEGKARARRGEALVLRRASAGQIGELRDAFATARREVVEGGGDPSLIDEALDFEAAEAERCDVWNALHPRGPRREPSPVDESQSLTNLVLRDEKLRRRRASLLSAADIGERVGVSAETVAAWMTRPEWEGAVMAYAIWEQRTLRAK